MNEPAWGIGDPLFLGLYAAACVATAIGVWLRRRRLLGARDAPVPSTGAGVYELAMLNGGPALAITIATSKLHRRGALVADRAKLRAAGRPRDGDEPLADLDHEVYDVIERTPGIRRTNLERKVAGGPSVRALESTLTDAGLLLDEQARSRVNRSWLAFVPVVALGAARLVAGGQSDDHLAILVVAVCAVALVAVLVARDRPHATALGRELLERRRGASAKLAHMPIGTEIPLAVALYGTGALWVADPGLASRLGIERERAATSGSGTEGTCAAGGGCGSGGGCGGGGCGS